LVVHVDKDGVPTFYDVNKFDDSGGKYEARKYGIRQFCSKYGCRLFIEFVKVEVINEDLAIDFYENRVKIKKWPYSILSCNCVTFVQLGLELGNNGEIPTDGSKNENPWRYPRDARDGYKKRLADLEELEKNKIIDIPIEDYIPCSAE